MPAPPNLPGGQLYMEYKHTPSGERHTLRIHLAWFDPSPIGSTNNRAYTSDGPVVPTDATILDTYNSFAALWQQYYNADWELKCVALLQYSSFTEVVQTPTPDFPTHNGTDTTELSGKLYFERKYKLLSQTGSRRELILAQVVDTTLRPHAFHVGASSGGVDARDQALMAYFSGASGTGFVMPDGNYAFSDTEMSVWWNKQPGFAGGSIHPGVYMQDEAPDTTDVPDHVLWIDTSSGHTPCPIKCWDATSSTWVTIQMDATGYPTTGGWRIEGFNEDGTPEPDPGWNPNLFLIRDPTGTPRLILDAAGLWLIQSNVIGSDYNLLLLQVIAGDWQFSGTGFTFGTLLDDYAHIGPEHPHVDYEHATTQDLVLPFGNCTETPTEMLVKVPSEGVPRYWPIAGSTTTGTEALGGNGDTVPLGSETCLGMRCGVSGECTKHLVSLYGAWADWLGPLLSGITDFALLALVIDPFFDALCLSMELATDIAIARSVQKVLSLGVGAITGSLFPSPNSDDQENIQRGLFCQLACTGTTVSVTSQDINPVWHDHVAGLTLDGLSRDLLCILIQFTPLADWQAIALHSGPSGLCDAWSCS